MIQEFYQKFHSVIRQSERDFYNHYDERHSYAELYDYMRRMNSFLDGRSNRRIAVHAEKSFIHYASVFAVILSNNTWVPINPEFPQSRIAEMLLLAQPDIMLTDQKISGDLFLLLENMEVEIVMLQDLIKLPLGHEFKFTEFKKNDFSMIYFTSGSTGKPKGVPLTHQNYILNVRNILEIVDLKPGEVFADFHDPGFVISIPILFPCVMCEGILAPAINKKDIMFPLGIIQENNVSVLITVPSTMARIRQMRPNGYKETCLHVVIMCGEPLHLDILEYILSGLCVTQIYDFYGSTEAAPWTFYHQCSMKDLKQFQSYGVVPIGKPIVGNAVRIGEDDELWVSGPQITPGYLGDISDDRLVEWGKKRWYRTGDKVVIHDGHYLCKGRLDSQVKIGGYRIELMDTEAHLRILDGVDTAICFVDGEGTQKALVAALYASRDIDLEEVREHLRSRIPIYMVPRKSFILKNLPLNKSGKVDRLAIRKIYQDSIS